jgi:hypothetical protein
MSNDKENARRAIDRATEAGQSDLDIPSAGLTYVSYCHEADQPLP